MAGAVEQPQLVADLADAEADGLGVGDNAVCAEGELEVVELGAAVAVRPPEARVLHIELGELRGSELDEGLAGRQGEALVHADLLDGRVEGCVDGCGGEIGDRDGDIDGGLRGVVIVEGGDYVGVAELEAADDAQGDRLPDSAVAVADAGD